LEVVLAGDSKKAAGAAGRLFKEKAVADNREQIRREAAATDIRVEENTARLKKLRLAKEADNRALPPKTKTASSRKLLK
jgi:hypothetical protein